MNVGRSRCLITRLYLNCKLGLASVCTVVHREGENTWRVTYKGAWASKNKDRAQKVENPTVSCTVWPRTLALPSLIPCTLMENMRAFETERMRGLLCRLSQRGRFSWVSLSCLNVWLKAFKHLALKALSVGESEKWVESIPLGYGLQSSSTDCSKSLGAQLLRSAFPKARWGAFWDSCRY